ncbi:MAG: hypothetical protein Kow0056_06700 [Coriobacteriia bacterium]
MAPDTRRRSISKALRSRKVAFWLLVGVAAWSAVGTTIEGAFSSPPFLAAVAWLLVSTLFCSWERTRWALGQRGREGRLERRQVERLKARPQSELGTPAPPEEAMEAVRRALRRVRLRVVAGPRLAEGVGGRWGLFGSPLFHWSLALLMAVLVAGQLTRAEGQIGVPVGSERVDEPASYGLLEEGPLFSGHSGLTIAVPEMPEEYVVDGLDRGPAPYVELRDGERVVAAGYVYPNHPLRHGTLLIHRADTGYSPTLALFAADGSLISRKEFLVDLDESQPGGLTPVDFALIASGGGDLAGRLVLALPESEEGTGTAMLRIGAPDGTVVYEGPVFLREPVSMPTGETLVLESVRRYARLSVADDWSVPFIYAFIISASLALVLAVFSPYRRAWVLVTPEGEGSRVGIVARHWRGSPLFAETVRAAILEELGHDGSPAPAGRAVSGGETAAPGAFGGEVGDGDR